MTSNDRSRFLLLLCFVAFIALGLPDAVIGVAWPAMRAHFGLSIDALGPLFITLTIGSVAASTASGSILARIGIGDLLAVSCFLTAVGLLGYTLVPSWTMLVALGLLAGAGAGAIDAAINTHAAVQYSARIVNVLHAFYGVGAAAGPALMTAVLVRGQTWQSGYRVIVAIEAALALAFILTRRYWPAPVIAHEDHKPARLAETLRLPAVRLSLLVFLVYTGCEAAAGAWVFSLLLEARNAPTAVAGTAVTLYWTGLFVSRLGYAFLPSDVNPSRVITLCVVVALAAMVVLLGGLNQTLDALAITLIGFASGPIFPSLIATTPVRVGARHAANAVGLQISVAAVGLASIPALAGVLASRMGLDVIPIFLTICWSVMLVAWLSLHALSSRGEPKAL